MDECTERVLSGSAALAHDVYNYKQIKITNHEEFTFNAILLNFTIDDKEVRSWVPFSLLRIDRVGGFWLPVWFIKRNRLAIKEGKINE